jgi:tRNA threonylcarbamoyladenosine biosynthesis protein TsaE
MNSKLVINREVSDESGTRQFVSSLKQFLQPGETFLLYGGLGSGKTFLVKAIAAELNVQNDVSSPSFALIHQYKADININHIDLYRIQDKSELINLGLEDILNSQSVNFIEWPQIIESNIFWMHYRIFIARNQETETGRRFELYKLC